MRGFCCGEPAKMDRALIDLDRGSPFAALR
jgi:hypothetical protein